MLKSLVVLLLIVNAALFAWTRGWLAPVLPSPESREREPERLRAQVRPERIVLLAPQAAVRAAEAASQAAAQALAASAAEVAPGAAPQAPEAPTAAVGASASPVAASAPGSAALNARR